MGAYPEAMHSTGKDDWATPQYIVDWCADHLGIEGFDLDACAKVDSAKAPEWIGPDREDELERDAMAGPWRRGKGPTWVWFNPPYSRKGGGIGKWCERAMIAARDEACVVACCVFAKTETVAWHESISKAHEVFFIRGRLRFVDPITGLAPMDKKGQPQSAPAPSILVFWRPGHSGPPTYHNLDLRAIRDAARGKL